MPIEDIKHQLDRHFWSLKQKDRGVNAADIIVKNRQQRWSAPFYRAAAFLFKSRLTYPLALICYGLGKLIAAPFKLYRNKKYLHKMSFREQWKPIFRKYFFMDGLNPAITLEGKTVQERAEDYYLRHFTFLPLYKVNAHNIKVDPTQNFTPRMVFLFGSNMGDKLQEFFRSDIDSGMKKRFAPVFARLEEGKQIHFHAELHNFDVEEDELTLASYHRIVEEKFQDSSNKNSALPITVSVSKSDPYLQYYQNVYRFFNKPLLNALENVFTEIKNEQSHAAATSKAL